MANYDDWLEQPRVEQDKWNDFFETDDCRDCQGEGCPYLDENQGGIVRPSNCCAIFGDPYECNEELKQEAELRRWEQEREENDR